MTSCFILLHLALFRWQAGVKMIALRCAGFDRVDLKAAEAHGITVARVPAYSHSAALIDNYKFQYINH